MLLKLILAGLLVASTFGVQYASEGVVAIISLYAFLYYKLVLQTFCGLITVAPATEKEDLEDAFFSCSLNGLASYILIAHSDYPFVGYLALPYILLATFTFLFAFLKYKQIIDVTEVSEDDEDY